MARPSRFRGPEYWRRFVPPGQQQVDWNNPLCADLRILAQLSGPKSIDLVSGAESTTYVADPTSGSTPFGQASIFAGGQGQQFAHAVSDSQFSGAALIQSTTSGAYQTLIDYDNGSSARIFQFRLNLSNQLEYIAFDSALSAYAVVASLPDFQHGAPVGFSAGGTTVRLLAGETVTDTAIGGTQATLASTHSPVVGYRVGAGAAFTGGISMYALWGRMLSQEEWLEWARYPGQLFKPLARRVISFSATAGANPTILGVATSAQAGTVAAITASNAVVLGRAIASAAGTVSVNTTASVSLVGAASPVAAGTVAPVIGTAVTAVGAAIPVAAGIVQVRVDTNPVLVGASISTATGTVSITTTGDVNVNLTGVVAQVQPGNVSVQADAPIGPLPSAFGGGGGHKGWDRKEYKRKRKFLDDLDRTVEEAATPPAPPAAARRIELDLSTLQAAITKPYIRPSVPPKPLVDDNEEEFLLIHLLLD